MSSPAEQPDGTTIVENPDPQFRPDEPRRVPGVPESFLSEIQPYDVGTGSQRDISGSLRGRGIRYAHLMSSNWTDGLRGMGLLLLPAAKGLHPAIRRAVAEEHERTRAAESAIKVLRTEIRSHSASGNGDMRSLANLGLYVCLFLRDQALLKMDWLTCTGALRRGFIARGWVTLLWDVAEKMRSRAFGKEMRDTVSVIGAQFLPQLNTVNSNATRFWKTHGDQLKTWRNVAAAHRDFDAAKQLDAMDQIDLDRILPIATDFNEVTQPTVQLVTEVLENLTVWDHVRMYARSNTAGE